MITLESVEQFMVMLTGGELPDGIKLAHQPKLDKNQAFSVIYYLQEQLKIIPDNFEMCECGVLYDSYCDGVTTAEYDEDSWYEDNEIPRAIVEENAGRSFCSSECEYNFLMENEVQS